MAVRAPSIREVVVTPVDRKIGLTIDTAVGGAVVLEAEPPAAWNGREGVHKGDIIVRVNGVPVVGQSGAEVVERLRACAVNTVVCLTVETRHQYTWSCPLCGTGNRSVAVTSCPYYDPSGATTAKFFSSCRACSVEVIVNPQ